MGYDGSALCDWLFSISSAWLRLRYELRLFNTKSEHTIYLKRSYSYENV